MAGRNGREYFAPSPSPTPESGPEEERDGFRRGTWERRRSDLSILVADGETSADSPDGSEHTSVRGASPVRVCVGRALSREQGEHFLEQANACTHISPLARGSSPLARSPLRASFRRIERLASSGSVSNLAVEFENEYGEWKLDEKDIDMTGSSLVGEGSSGCVVRARYNGVDVAVKLL